MATYDFTDKWGVLNNGKLYCYAKVAGNLHKFPIKNIKFTKAHFESGNSLSTSYLILTLDSESSTYLQYLFNTDNVNIDGATRTKSEYKLSVGFPGSNILHYSDVQFTYSISSGIMQFKLPLAPYAEVMNAAQSAGYIMYPCFSIRDGCSNSSLRSQNISANHMVNSKGSYSSSTQYSVGDIIINATCWYRNKTGSKNYPTSNTTHWEVYTPPSQYTPQHFTGVLNPGLGSTGNFMVSAKDSKQLMKNVSPKGYSLYLKKGSTFESTTSYPNTFYNLICDGNWHMVEFIPDSTDSSYSQIKIDGVLWYSGGYGGTSGYLVCAKNTATANLTNVEGQKGIIWSLKNTVTF